MLAPGLLYSLPEQGRHVLAPSRLYVPLGHSMHNCPPSAYLPASHNVQLPAMNAEYLPPEQWEQTEEPAAENVPGKHALQVLASMAPCESE